MPFSKKMLCLALIAFLACVAIAVPTEKESVCCREVSIKKITIPITGFRVQQAKPPCVKAVIFYTSKGAECSHWKEGWVRKKVTELRKLQAAERKNLMASTTTSAFQTANATSGFHTTLNN